MKECLVLFILIVVMIGCQKEKEASIDDELLVYIFLFEEEAKARGKEFDIKSMDVSAHIMNIDERGVLGQCLSFSDNSREIVVDQDYWDGLNDLDKEYLMMHELGHCILDRDHLNMYDQFGNCISIMQGGNEQCMKKYNENNRKELLDELFNI